MSLRSRLHTAQHRVEGRTPQRIRFWSTLLIVLGWPMVTAAMIFLPRDDFGQSWLGVPGSVLVMLGVVGHLIAIEMEDIAEDGDHVGGEDW